MEEENKVSITVDDEIYDGWKSVKIASGIDQICRAFILSITDNFPGNLSNFRRLQPGQAVVLKIGKDVVCTGYITSTPVRYDAKTITVEVQGKSKTVDLVDCCSPWAAIAFGSSAGSSSDSWKDVDPEKNKFPKVQTAKEIKTSWHNQPTEKIIADLCRPYGISVICKSDIGSKHTNFTVNPGEKVYESINRLLTKDNLIVTDDAYGNLVIDEVPNNSEAEGTLESGKNILSGKADFDATNIYSTYAVLGQHKGSDLAFGKHISQDKGISVDDSIPRYRLLVIKDTGQSSQKISEDRAAYEKNFRRAVFRSTTFFVQGWRNNKGHLWEPNQLARIKDNILGISQTFLIRGIVQTLNEGGTKTEIQCLPKEGYARDASKSDSTKTNKEGNASNAWSEVK